MTPSATTAGKTATNEDSEELARFRQEWLDELKHRREAASAITAGGDSQSRDVGASQTSAGEIPKGPLTSPTRSTFGKRAATDAYKRHEAANLPDDALPASHPALTNAGIQVVTANLPPSLQNALKIYKDAVEHEQNGDLDEALLLYRRAFRIDDQVDRAFRREEKLKAILQSQTAVASSKGRTTGVDELAGRFEKVVSVKETGLPTTVAVATGSLAQLIKEFPAEVQFEPLVENEPIHLKVLPDELLVSVLKRLDPTSIERFGSVSRKARLLTLDSGVWRPLVKLIYRPPQIPDDEDLIEIMERCLYDYRRVFIEQPRIRMDGVYIAICHYIRPGLSENRWVNISHLITYHRYLRFYPNGQVLSLLVNEEHGPQQVIPMLKPTLRMKGFYIGTWKLEGTTVHLTDLIDASGRYFIPHATDTGPKAASIGTSVNTHANNMPAPEYAKYAFGMMLTLKSRPLGRWNKMEILGYESVKMDTGDSHPISLKHERPFWFSKVKSYGI
ncbi:hypothetical protein CVT24_008591 [Panaeolus cyanescens]|uniref:F-box only protein 9 n=1 Tax=Panaeolus cyanescens TaxID=181874 RepID=A0A409VDQ4_9AGAR|nr:hypothetical protein CVT24_008591 [Panaeolus cyanescens]